jgi:spermidine/putrescine-binding protein
MKACFAIVEKWENIRHPFFGRRKMTRHAEPSQFAKPKNISANFHELTKDPYNQYSVSYNWNTTGLVIRISLAAEPVTRWSDPWDPRYKGKVGIWKGIPRILERILSTL